MDFSNDGISIYHRSVGLYARHEDGELVRYAGKHGEWIQGSWSAIRSEIMETRSSQKRYFDRTLSHYQLSHTTHEDQSVEVFEMQNPEHRLIIGLILNTAEPGSWIERPLFDEFFSAIALSESLLDITPPSSAAECDSITEKIVDLFDKKLRYQVPNDQWGMKGREYFTSKVRYYTSRNLRLDLCLPAFPCKSSNPEKVATTLPDKGEELALRRLHYFAQQVEQIYKPGAQVWIISDGHVFSDCIGVDDQTVDDYGAHLKDLNDAIKTTMEGPTDRVCFRSLVDMFNLGTIGGPTYEKAESLNIPSLKHHLGTALKEDAELCRRILMAGCQAGEAGLRAKIDSQDAAILALYRGFSRFMLEDLDLNPLTQPFSRSQRKKLASKVSFEMILRNQAYSNLVELIFPDHVRLSIHAHNNAGPKFGIRLFDPAMARATQSLDPNDKEVSSHDLLHIPTPWHNSVAMCAGESTIHLIKSSAVRKALSTQHYGGAWVEGDLFEGRGGFFSLQKVGLTSVPTTNERVEQSISKPEKRAIKPIGAGNMSVGSKIFRLPMLIYNFSIGSLMSVVRFWMRALGGGRDY